jgi:ferredoxin
MTYVIAGSCIKDDSCIEVCPVDCIHPKPGAPDFEVPGRYDYALELNAEFFAEAGTAERTAA